MGIIDEIVEIFWFEVLWFDKKVGDCGMWGDEIYLMM